MSRKITFPHTVVVDSVSVTVYRLKKKGGYITHEIGWRQGGQYKRRTRSDLAEAIAEANQIARDLANGRGTVTELSGRDREIYLRAKALLGNLDIPLDRVAEEYCNAVRLTGQNRLLEAASFFAAQKNRYAHGLTISQVVDQFLEHQALAGNSDKHVNDLKSRLNRLARAFPNVPLVTADDDAFQTYFKDLSESATPRTVTNHFRIVGSLLTFARLKKLIPPDHKPLASVAIPKVVRGEPEIFTVDEMKRLMQHCRPEMIGFMAVRAFSGVRFEECLQLSWDEHIDMERRLISIPASISKVRTRRVLRMQPNLFAWLQRIPDKTGPLCRFSYVSKIIEALAKNANVAWKWNGLRASFISYRVSQIGGEVGQVALESGNSESIIKRDYLRPGVSAEEAGEWFNIFPPPVTLPAERGPTGGANDIGEQTGSCNGSLAPR